ncbi:MAG: SDR family NAD(P)-dependent oxidoreductase [Bacteroidota bacterium]
MKNLNGKTAIVTGGASGIGYATVRRLVQEGCSVTIWDVRPAALEDAVRALGSGGGTVYGHVCDVTDRARVTELAGTAEREMGRVDILINNAGYVLGGTLLEGPADAWERTVEVNLMAVIQVTQAVLPGMYERNEGHVVNISSAAGMVGVPGLAVYCATKWGVWGFTEAMRMESRTLGKTGMHWSSIHPSYLAEGMFAGAKLTFPGNLILPLIRSHDVIARAIVNGALKKNRFSPKRPPALHLTLRLRGLLPDRWFQFVLVLLGIPRSMSTWKGQNS